MISGSPLKLGSITLGLLVVLLTAGCSTTTNVSETQPTSETSTANASSTPAAITSAAPPSPVPQVDFFQKGLEKANSAATIAGSAQSRDDWTLVANRWQQAIDLMASVPTTSANRQKAQGKLSEYRRNLTVARQRANQPASQAAVPPRDVIVVEPSPAPLLTQPNPVAATQVPSTNQPRVFSAPIVRREGGTPVIQVVFNGSQPFDMIVDTGASGTLITQQMAAALDVVPAGQAQVDTASSQSVTFPLGYVRSIQVDQAIARNVLVAVAGSGLQTGLLGHDFFGNYDVTVRQDRVEFSER